MGGQPGAATARVRSGTRPRELGWLVLGAAGLLTALPLPRQAHGEPRALTVAAFGAVGLVLGAALAGVEAALAPALAPGPRSAVELFVLAALCGAIHLDGLADAADGIFGGRSPEQRLAIMRDSRVGAFGATALILVVALELTALASVGAGRGAALVVAVGASRAAGAVALAAAPAVRREGLGALFAGPGRGPAALTAVATVALAGGLLSGVRGLAVVAVAAVVAGGVALIFRRRVGGITGDGCGAAVELALAAALLCLGARA